MALLAVVTFGAPGAGLAWAPDSCPCDSAETMDVGVGQGECAHDDHLDAPSGTSEDAPRDEGCDDGCPECSCCPGALVAVLDIASSTFTAGPLPLGPPEVHAAPGVGVRFDVFRPPRSLP